MVRLLLDKGADVNAQHQSGTTASDCIRCKTALDKAADARTRALLIERGGKPGSGCLNQCWRLLGLPLLSSCY